MLSLRVLSIAVILVHYASLSITLEVWSSKPAGINFSEVLQQGFSLGNGKLGVIPHGPPNLQKLNLNVDSLMERRSYYVEC